MRPLRQHDSDLSRQHAYLRRPDYQGLGWYWACNGPHQRHFEGCEPELDRLAEVQVKQSGESSTSKGDQGMWL